MSEFSSQVIMQTLESNTSEKERYKVDNVVATVNTRVRGAILTSMDKLVIPRGELAIRSASDSSTGNPSSDMYHPNQSDISGNTNGPHISASSRSNSNTNLDLLDETYGNITDEAGWYLVGLEKRVWPANSNSS